MNLATIDANDGVATIIQAFATDLEDPAKPFSLLVRFQVDIADGDKVEAAFCVARADTLNEPGCISFDLSRHPRHPGRYVVYERWRSLADLDAHLRTTYISMLRNQLNKWIVGAPEFQVLVPAGAWA